MMKNKEGETPYHGMMHWIPVMSFDVQWQDQIVALRGKGKEAAMAVFLYPLLHLQEGGVPKRYL